MARPNTGEVTRWPWKDGKTITFGTRLYAYGRRHRLVFGTNTQGWNDVRAEIELESSGRRRDPDRFRDRVLARSARLANEQRAEQGLPSLPKITPHSLRRTWAMLAAQAGRDPHWIADQIGHTSAAFTLQVYQQTRNRRLTDRERQAIWELMRFADEPAECPFTRQVTRTDDPEFRPVNRPIDDFSPSNKL